MIITVRQKFPVYKVTIQSIDFIDGTFTVPLKVNNLDRPVLATLSNSRINQLKSKYPRLDGITFDNEDDKLQHPISYIHHIYIIHIIFGAGDFANIKAGGFIAGKAGEPLLKRHYLDGC